MPFSQQAQPQKRNQPFSSSKTPIDPKSTPTQGKRYLEHSKNEIVPLPHPKPHSKPLTPSHPSPPLSPPSNQPLTIHSQDIKLGPNFPFNQNRFSLDDRFKFSANLSKLVKNFPTKDFNFTPGHKIIEDHVRMNSAGKKIRKFHTQNKFCG